MSGFNAPFTALAAALLLLSTPASAAPSPERYQLVNSYTGQSFFDGWSFWDQADPTNGFVDYLDQKSAMDANLAGFIYNNATREHTAFMGVDHTTMNPTAGRASVRIASDQTWSRGGLFVADVRHTPQGACGSWPALWLVGPDWPARGEIDIIEGVNDNRYNSMTLHTGPGCASRAAQETFLGTQVTTDCGGSSGSNTGCSIQANASQSYDAGDRKMATHAAAGPAFNQAGGGVYATLWDSASGVTIWMFPRTAVPADLVAGTPEPATWTARPVAQFGGPGCDYTRAFSKQQLVVDTTFCGDWAGKPEVWQASEVCSAQSETCRDFVAHNPEAFEDAYWEIGSIKVYQTSSQQRGSGTSPIAGGASSGKRADFPATLGDVLPESSGDDDEEDADCTHMAGTPTTSTIFSHGPTATAASTVPSSTASGDAMRYGNPANFTASHDDARRGGRVARLLQ